MFYVERLQTSLSQAENQLQMHQSQTSVKDTEVKGLMEKHGQVGYSTGYCYLPS